MTSKFLLHLLCPWHKHSLVVRWELDTLMSQLEISIDFNLFGEDMSEKFLIPKLLSVSLQLWAGFAIEFPATLLNLTANIKCILIVSKEQAR